MNLKNIVSTLTSTKALILLTAAAIQFVNEVRLSSAVMELKLDNALRIEKIKKELQTESINSYASMQASMLNTLDEYAYNSGVIVDYTLIEKNTEAAVNRGFSSALSHQAMLLSAEKNAFSTFILERLDGSLTLMQVIERPDTVPLIKEYKEIY